MKLIITFPSIAAKYEAAKHVEDYKAFSKRYKAIREAMREAMGMLEETMFAVTMERAEDIRFYSDHIGLHPDFDTEKDGFVIEAWRLTVEFIQTLEDLQKLGSFKMHFETDTGEIVSGRWWWHEDDCYHIYAYSDSEAQDYYDEKLKAVMEQYNERWSA